MTDTVVYETKGKPTYVIQFESENKGEWIDTYPTFRSEKSAIEALNSKTATPYPYRIVRRQENN